MFQYGLEKRKFTREWIILEKQYMEEGVTKEAIQELYDYDWSWFCKCRNYSLHTQKYPDDRNENNHVGNCLSLYSKFETLCTTNDKDIFSGQDHWIENIEDLILYKKLKEMSVEERTIVKLYVIDGYNQREIAQIFGVSQVAISKKLKRMREMN